MTDVFFYVQHLHGTGHLYRAAAIARACERAGLSTLVVSGGVPVPDLDFGNAGFAQLPPVATADESFSRLVDAAGREIDDTFREARREELVELFRRTRPRVLVTEMFPFGRRQLAFELLPLIDEARASRPRPAIVSSVRDVLVAGDRPEKAAWMRDMAASRFDAVVVHGDPRLIPFERTFPHAAEIAGMIRYSGYVVRDPPAAAGGGGVAGEVLVSIGGGAFGGRLASAALRARPLCGLNNATWRFLMGHNLPEAEFGRLRSGAAPGVVVERARADFQILLAGCRLSISQGGYNTAMEVLRAGPPAVMVPFAGGRQNEQVLRARRLAELDAVTVVDDATLSAESLARGIDRALSRGRRRIRFRDDGARRTAGILREAMS